MVEYQHESVTHPFGSTAGDHIAHIGATLPLTTVGRVKATHPVTWFVRGVVLTSLLAVWMFTIGWVFLFTGMVLTVIEESWESMQERRGRRTTVVDGIEIPHSVMKQAEEEAEISGADPERIAVAKMVFHRDGPRRTSPVGDESDRLEDVEDGAGCAEMWEHLSEYRDGEDR